MKPKAYVDCQALDEDTRIQLIGATVMGGRNVVGVVVETQEKADRYVAKLKEKFPAIIVKDKGTPLGKKLGIVVKLAPPVFGQS